FMSDENTPTGLAGAKEAGAKPILFRVDLQFMPMDGLQHLPEVAEGPTTEPTINILLVDDNPGDVRMISEGLKEALPTAKLSVCPDGVEAIRFLRREGRHSKAPRPDLVLLDLR